MNSSLGTSLAFLWLAGPIRLMAGTRQPIGKEVPTMSLLVVLYKTAVWAARSAVLIATVMLFTVVLRFAKKR